MNYKKWESMTDEERTRWHRNNELLTSVITATITAVVVTLSVR